MFLNKQAVRQTVNEHHKKLSKEAFEQLNREVFDLIAKACARCRGSILTMQDVVNR